VYAEYDNAFHRVGISLDTLVALSLDVIEILFREIRLTLSRYSLHYMHCISERYY
jgi:hypothetical protein